MKKTLAVLAIFAAPAFAYAASTITFQGEVSTQTCVAEVNGQTNGIVLLNTVPTSALAAVNSTTGLTPFTMTVKGCPTAGTPTNIATNFLGHSATVKGNLGNRATTGAATKVQLQLMKTSAGTEAIILSGTTSVPGLVLPANQSSASHQFGVQYISEEGGATAGSVQGIAEYSLNYN
ncbi:fimbrial protein [Diaphorobacter aerolatus]|uniref:Type 1 fimbrial protein n=1 Tax=Diaphorobacter aerolatus TaxID=1288495 RepID=A0A7H0GMF1_9BURK|nr:fimbrial protein [Diaphorobacter aerolatus]QNP49467.1 type 1 fimbrial protein [Diaphorobacter aerolatus]